MNPQSSALAALGAFALGAVALLWLADVDERCGRSNLSSAGASGTVGEVARRVELVVPEPVCETSAARTALSPSPAGPRIVPRVERARHELALLFRAEPFDRVSFDLAAHGLARALGGADGETLRAFVADRNAGLDERLAACELLRELEERDALEPRPLPADVRIELAALAGSRSPSACAESAARALAALGSGEDSRPLIECLLGADGALRERCARALAHARDPSVARELARALGATRDPRTLELTAVALSAAVSRTRLTLAMETREEIGTQLRALLMDPHPAVVRRRALVALAALGCEPEPELLSMAGDDELALILTSGSGSSALEAALLNAPEDPGRRFVLAEMQARSPAEASPLALLIARDTLLERCEADADPALRRRALYALGTLGDPAALPLLCDTARFDPDPALRATALRALRALDARDTLALVAAADCCPQVRALAVHELAWLDP